MCGICGYIGKDKINKDIISRTLELMKRRGPDSQDYKIINKSNNNIYLLHSRLSIIDLLNRANQPFYSDKCTLVFNGEIYNYLEIKKELEKKGYIFSTSSDTEVLLKAYLHYGNDCVKNFEGMWSFAIYDERNNKLFLSRDRFAEKPLYYFVDNNGFYFGSEIKFIKLLIDKNLDINYNQIYRYFVNGYKSLYKQKETYFSDVHEIDFASNLIINEDLSFKEYKYWHPAFNPVEGMSIEQAIEGTKHYLNKSVQLRLRSDVPLAFCLSGGIDSGGLVSIAAKEFKYDTACYSIIDRDERYNEYDNIKAVVDDTKSKSILIYLDNKNNYLDRLNELVKYHDAPVATISYLIHSYLSEAISKDGYKVVFSGTAADELFTGYYDHFNLFLYEIRNYPEYNEQLENWKKHISGIVRNPFFQNPELYFTDQKIRDHIYLNNEEFASYLKKDFHEEFIEENYSNSLLRNRMLNEVFNEATRVILHEDDLNSMYNSIENRSPYLDKDLFEFAYTIPNHLLINNGYGKYILREALKGNLTDKVRLDRRKKGFNASISSIIDFSNKEIKEKLLNESPVFDIIKRDKIGELFYMKSIPNSYSKFLFNFINIKIFLENNL